VKPMSRPATVVSLLLVVCISLAGCTDESDPLIDSGPFEPADPPPADPPPADPPPADPPPADPLPPVDPPPPEPAPVELPPVALPPVDPAPLVFPTPAACPATTVEVPLFAKTEAEAVFLRTLRACETSTPYSYLVTNAGPAVWVLEYPSRPAVDHSASTREPLQALTQGLFYEAMGEVTGGVGPLALTPGSSATVTLVAGELPYFSFGLDHGTQAVWEVTNQAVSSVQENSIDGALRLLSRGRPARQAVLTCGVSGASVGTTVYETANGEQAYLDLMATVAVDGGECAQAIRRAEEAAPPVPRPPLVLQDLSSKASRGQAITTRAGAALRAAANGLMKVCSAGARPC